MEQRKDNITSSCLLKLTPFLHYHSKLLFFGISVVEPLASKKNFLAKTGVF